jgi:superfamily II DNA helicase RecQ
LWSTRRTAYPHGVRTFGPTTSELKRLFPDTPTSALTATATAQVITDIKRDLKIPRCRLFKASFFRENLFIRVCYKDGDSDDVLLAYLATLDTAASCIVYCVSKKECQRVAELCAEAGLLAGHYHAGLSITKRATVQAAWQKGVTPAVPPCLCVIAVQKQ